MEKIRVGVVGATGYAGSEICRLIAGHPQAELAAISSVSFEGMALSQVYPAYNQMIDWSAVPRTRWWSKATSFSPRCPTASPRTWPPSATLGQDLHRYGARTSAWRTRPLTRSGTAAPYQDKALHEKAVYGPAGVFPGEDSGEEGPSPTRAATPQRCPWPWCPPWRPGLSRVTAIIADCKSGVTGAGRKAHPGQPLPRAQRELYRLQGGGPPPQPRRLSRPCPRWWAAP